MTCVLALDQASSTGWAVVRDGAVVAAGSWDLGDGIKTSGRGASPLDVQHVLKVQRIRSGVDMLIRTHQPTVVACEREFGRGVGGRLLVSLYTAVQEAAYDAGLPCLGIRLGDWRREMHGTAGGSGASHKAKAMAACLELGVDVPDEDAAEAVQIARFVERTVPVTEAAPKLGRAA